MLLMFLATDFFILFFIVPLYLSCSACSEHEVHICPQAAVDANVVLA